MNDLEECFQWGGYVVQSLRESGRRGVFVASGALSHRLVRGPEKWPLPEHRELDERFAGMLSEGKYEAAWKWLPEFASAVDAEMGARHLAMMLGVLAKQRRQHRYRPRLRPILGKRETTRFHSYDCRSEAPTSSGL
jgi:3,4-dihydroxyphenylacetate 2,3-dioxygenase